MRGTLVGWIEKSDVGSGDECASGEGVHWQHGAVYGFEYSRSMLKSEHVAPCTLYTLSFITEYDSAD